MKLSRILIVGMGGLFGSMLRYMISSAAALHFGDFPVGTMIVNVLGGFLMGFIMEACVGLWPGSWAGLRRSRPSATRLFRFCRTGSGCWAG